MSTTGTPRGVQATGGGLFVLGGAAILVLALLGQIATGVPASVVGVWVAAGIACVLAGALLLWRSGVAVEAPTWTQRIAWLWEAALLTTLGAFMFHMRMLPYNALVGGDRAYYIGTDPFYHYRETLGIVRSFPSVPRWDPWTFYPNGTGTGQFGSLFDWSAAAVVVLTQGKSASEAYVQMVLGIYPAVLGALLIVPFYLLARKLLGVPGGIVASITVALLPGEFLIRAVAGYSDHHVAEAFFCLVSILGVYVAATHGHDARARFGDWRAFGTWRAPLLWGLLGGVALAANFYAWPPAVLFLGILTVWLTIVILLEDAKEDGNGFGYAFGAGVAFVTAGILMVPTIETTFLGEFNTYGLLQPALCFAAAAWLMLVHKAAAWTRERRMSAWIVPGAIAALGTIVFFGVQFAASNVYRSLQWGLSWITGFNVPRTTLTIAEARQAEFFCSSDSAQFSCLANDFGAAAPISFLVMIGLFVWVLVKRRRADILLLLWSFVIFQATRTQIRFSYYLALNVALLIGWLAARASEWTGLEAALARLPPKAVEAQKGRKTKRVEAKARAANPLQIAAVAAVLLIVLPGNVIQTTTARPAWETSRITGADGDLVMWMQGLDWMREHTPDAGVDLGLVVPKPPPGELYDYPPQAYGVLTWWDYGHWIQTIAQRPPVANPFQQAAPFASTWFTERDPVVAEKLLDDWVQGKGPVRYIFIDDEIATGKWGAITVWAHSQNASRDRWADGDYLQRKTFQTNAGPAELYTVGPQYTESMMGRLFDKDGSGLSHYRLVWEHPQYEIIGTVANQNNEIRCLHDVIPSRNCPIFLPTDAVIDYKPGTTIEPAPDTKAIDVFIAPRLKLFERVLGAHVTGTTTPGGAVSVTARVVVLQENGSQRPFDFRVDGVAGPDGRFDVVFPYANKDVLGKDQGGTDSIAQVAGIFLTTPTSGGARPIEITDDAARRGGTVPV